MTGQLFSLFDILFGNQAATIFGDFSFNNVGNISHIHPINHRLFVSVFAHYIFIEEPKGALVRGCRQPNQEGIEVVKYLLPNVVD